ncbi:hypothetical protein [Priestia aryabhattai]
MKTLQASIPMSPDRFFKTFEWIRKNLSVEELYELKQILTVRESSEIIRKREYYIFSTINQLAQEILIEKGLLLDKENFSPQCTIWKQRMRFINDYNIDNFLSSKNCTVFNYKKPFKASFTYIGHGNNKYFYRFYENMINTFSEKIITNYNNLSS